MRRHDAEMSGWRRIVRGMLLLVFLPLFLLVGLLLLPVVLLFRLFGLAPGRHWKGTGGCRRAGGDPSSGAGSPEVGAA